MKYYIHNLARNTYFVVESFDKMIEWFARHNKPNRHEVLYGIQWWHSRYENRPIDPKIHHWSQYNSILTHVAMHPNEYCTRMGYDFHSRTSTGLVELQEHEIMVKDELNRTIDPRHYWDKIATCKVKSQSYRRKEHPFVFRFDPVPRTRKRRGGGHSHVRTFQERKLSCDPEIKEYVNPRRNMMNLPSSWDQHDRITNHCWKAKKLAKQWMKHL